MSTLKVEFEKDLPNATRTNLLAFGIALLFLYLRTFRVPIVPFAVNGDEILFFSRALRILHGQVIYRDFFELVTPGTELLYALGFRLFGVRGWVMEAWHIVLGTSLCLVITSIARRILRGAAVFLPMLLFLAFDLSSAMDVTHHWWGTLAALSAVAVLMPGQESWRIVVAGGLCGIATLFTQVQGALALLAFIAFLVFLRGNGTVRFWKQIGLLLLPFICLCTSVLGYYAYEAGTRRLVYDLLIFPLTGLSGTVNSPRTYLHQLPRLHGAGDLVRWIPFLVIYSLVPYVYFLSLRDLSKIKDGPTQDQRKQLVLLNLVGLDLCLAVSSGPTFFRLCTVAPPALLLCVVMIYQPGEVRKLARYTLWCVSVASMIWLPIHRQMQWHRPLLLPTGKITFTDKGQWQEMGWLLQRTSPGDIVFNQSAMTLYLGLENPTHAEFVNNDDFTSVQDVKLILDALQKHPAKYVVLGPDIPTTPHDHAGPFRDYIHAHYCLEQTFFLGPAQSPEGLWRLSKETPHIQGGNLY
ncbi:hypothetical protein [Terriglobus saanensis]|uniref:Glycosyltransferase RgtA/B/C/D-like domain-containing protein n=1 Tax=Terriglobus saanensis (strain ATCC BAA-1853 / DSM 23119 / SP1PR4) TaxID=401053 RepID=E8V1Y9_TERSS|nr:hypothetical protein [Terriglobus saanensis]ADV83477.1 hypothetical protein AciPR4_2703 [Terriglobus saanensis SP1PR4]